MSIGRVVIRILSATLLTLPLVSCSGSPSGSTVLTADMPLHLEQHLDAATIEGSKLPAEPPGLIDWSFDQPQPDWRAFSAAESRNPMLATSTDDALRVIASNYDRLVVGADTLLGVGIYTDIPGLLALEPAHLLIRARTESAGLMAVVFDDPEGDDSRSIAGLFQEVSEPTPMIADGTVQSYLLPLDTSGASGDACCRIGVVASPYEAGSVDILSLRVVSRAAAFAVHPLGVKTVAAGSEEDRRTLFTHTPVRVSFNVRVPLGGRLDVGLGVVQDDAPVAFRVTVIGNGRQGESSLLEETLGDKANWAQRSVDLSAFEGQTVTLALKADADTPGTVALWAAPTLSGSRDAGRPNVLFYIIDGGSAELMSVYGYNRRTTPNLERLAAEGVVFERAYSNASWTVPSTVSFMTGLLEGAWPAAPGSYLSEQAATMAEYMHRGGYQTGVFTATPYAGKMYGLDQGVDFLWNEAWSNESSARLHRAFREWREAYPGQPYWSHFQTVDAHRPWSSVIGFTGLFGRVDARRRFEDWQSRLDEAGWQRGPRFSDTTKWPPAELRELFERAGVDLTEYVNTQRALYDEGMAHNDYQIGRLVNRIKAAGEWENTIFILAADHAHGNAGVAESRLRGAPYVYEEAIFSPWRSHIPMIVIWPARIAAGQRFSQPVSMIDMLPTILDLAGLPGPEITQGQSLAPLLLGEEGWEPRPVIFASDGRIEVVDGRWGASLLGREPLPPEENGREARLLLFDLLNDPYLSRSLHEERPDLVEKYTDFLEAERAVHEALALRLARSGEEAVLTPEQLETLRSLGYIR